jgi:hypothetical protein
MMLCKSGRHYWLDPADAEKCCNGWKRILLLPGDEEPDMDIRWVRGEYGYAWMQEDER